MWALLWIGNKISTADGYSNKLVKQNLAAWICLIMKVYLHFGEIGPFYVLGLSEYDFRCDVQISVH